MIPKALSLPYLSTVMINKFQRSLRLGYGFSLFMLLVVCLISYLTVQSLMNSNRAVAHSDKVIATLEKLLSVMKDAETGQRGYLLSGQIAFLEPYNGAYREAGALTDQLKTLTADNQNQQANIAVIRQVLTQRLNTLQQLISKKQNGGTLGSADLESSKDAMDSFRAAIAKAEGDENRLLNERTATLNYYSTLTPIFLVLAAVLAIGTSGYFYFSVIRDLREKERLRLELEQSEEETQALNEELTAANEEITAANEELTAINEELVKAREELSQANETLESRVTERTQALQESEEETQALNEELTAINEEMAATNEELMATNEELAESERRLQELVDELRQADERSAKLAAIVESSDDAIIGKDLNGVVTAWNRGAEHIFGYSEAEIVGQPILKLIPEDLHHEEPFILGRLRNGEKIDHHETIRRRADGGLINVSLTISPIHDKEGRVIGVSKIARDISEQKRDEQRKNDFIGMASHELKTPLTSLTALVQVLQQKLRVNDDPFVPQALNKAHLQTKKMSSLINGFLNVSRLESGKLEIVKQDFDLTELAKEQLEEIRLTVSSHTFVFEPDHAVTVLADREKIGSVISNLLTNAVKYSPKGKVIKISCTMRDGQVLFSVQDEGMGIRAQDLPRIFDRYYRVGSEHTRHISGFGVGLYLSAEIIQRHAGRIWAESEKSVGSTFIFILPVA
ncbi:PAS domain S-box-containing protein [Mucilaginibacter pineti]|uniref:histidine kinase n=2 Tax=Mucilaginibacter pineti TaxID=1391627 RepID=A0A1G7JUL8_9SPHI|nr:PAS domain S-box-containing protein [Mucilaginibacter pineti]